MVVFRHPDRRYIYMYDSFFTLGLSVPSVYHTYSSFPIGVVGGILILIMLVPVYLFLSYFFFCHSRCLSCLLSVCSRVLANC